MTKRIPIKDKVLNIIGRPMQIGAVDDDYNIIWDNKERGEPKLEDADTFGILRLIIFNVPRDAGAPADPRRSLQLWEAAESAMESKNGTEPSEPKQYIEVPDKVYDWLHNLLLRELPLDKEARDKGVVKTTYAYHLWGNNSYKVVRQLKDPDHIAQEEED